jgi:glutathione S-transferase
MIVYGASMSPYVRKVLAFGAEKGIALENRPVGFDSDDPDFHAASPFRKIPAFRDGDFGISDSSAIIAYLDSLRPEPNLIPTEPKARARCIWFEEFADTMVMDCGRKLFFNRIVAPTFMGRPGDLAAADAAERDLLPPLLDYLETVAPASGFLVEDRITLADLAVASPFANVIHHLGIVIDRGRYPRALAYLEGIIARPSLREWVDKEAAFLAKVRGAGPGPAQPASPAPATA